MTKLHRRVATVVILTFLSVMSCGIAYGIDLQTVLRMPDNGFGSEVLGIYSSPGGGYLGLTGDMKDGAGRSLPVIWNIPDVTVVPTGIALPMPPNSEGRAIGGTVFPNGDIAIVGNVSGPQMAQAVLWRKPAAGGWSLPMWLSGNADQSLLRGFQNQGYQVQGVLAAAGSIQTDGRWRPILYRISPTDVQSEELPIPASATGDATGIDIDIPVGRAVSGTVRNAAGATRAVVWIDRGNGWATFPIDTPGNANSQANSVAIFESGWSTCGAVMQSARTRGFCADSADNLNLLTPLDGYDNSSALRHNQPFDDGAGPFNNIVTGISWNAGGTPVATVWINGQPSPAQQLLLDPNAVADVTAFKPTGNPAVNIGQIVDSTGNGQPRGAVFLNSNIVVPDSLSIVAGRYGEGKLAGLWHNDGDEFSIRTLSVDGVRTATVDLKLLTATQTGPTTWIYTLTIVARVESNGAGVTGTLNIFQRNESDLYVLLQSRALTDNEQLITFTFPNGLWRNPTTGLLETRLEFIQNGNRPAAVLIESMQMTYE